VRGLKLGVDRKFTAEGTDPALVGAIEEAITTWARLGAEIVAVEMPAGTATLRDAWTTICAAEAARAHRDAYPSRANAYGAFFGAFLAFGATITQAQYAAAQDARARFAETFHAVLARADAIVCPSGGCAFPVDAKAQYGNNPIPGPLPAHFTFPANLAGTPTLTLPCGVAASGVPFAVQLLGRRMSEATLLRIGQAFEDATHWHERHPPV
jgi:amidase